MSETPSVLTRVANATGAIPPLVTRIVLVLAVFVVGGLAGWIGRGVLAGPADVPTMSIYQDWRLLCPVLKDKDNSCELSQEVFNEKVHARVARLVMLKDKDKSTVLAVTVPIDVFLEPGMGLRLGTDQVRVFQYKTCTEEGCLAVIPLDDQLIASLDKATDASVEVVAQQTSKAVALPFSTKGYSEARKAFLGNEAKRNSLVAEIVVMKTVRSGFVGLVAAVAALSMLAAPAWSAKPAPATAAAPQQKTDPNKPIEPNESKDFGDWTVRCYPVASPSPCEMVQLLVNKKTGHRVLGVMIVYVPSRDEHVMQIALPLGVMLQNGAVLNSDTYTSGVLRFNRCDMQGCYVVMPLDAGTLGALGAGDQGANADRLGRRQKVQHRLLAERLHRRPWRAGRSGPPEGHQSAGGARRSGRRPRQLAFDSLILLKARG